MKTAYAPLLALVLLIPLSADAGDKHKEHCVHPIQECLNHMITKLKSTGFIGVELEHTKKDELIVTKIISGTPAEKAGIIPGDELFAINGIEYAKASKAAIGKQMKPGKEVTCTIKRNGASKHLQVTLAPMPADIMAKYIGKHMMSHADAEAHASIEP